MVNALVPVTVTAHRTGTLAKFIREYDGNIYDTAAAIGSTPEQCRLWLRDKKVIKRLLAAGCEAPHLYRDIATLEDRKRLLTAIMWDERNQTKTRVEATKILGMMEGDFIERRVITGADGGPLTTVSMNISAEMPLADLEERIKRLRGVAVKSIEDEILTG